ncbi:MAG: hypothetical protein JXR37_36330 [Kiritimatiellae bacterium]|nr:hypothetical protein [Kiritimatiellia bacterium]
MRNTLLAGLVLWTANAGSEPHAPKTGRPCGALTSAPPSLTQVGWTSPDEAPDWPALRRAAGRIVGVTTKEALSNALAQAQPGDYICIRDSVRTVDWSGFRTTVDGTAERPIVIGPETERAVTFTAERPFLWIRVTNDRYVVGGFRFHNFGHGVFHVRNGADCRFTRLDMRNVGRSDPHAWAWEVSSGSARTRIDHCYMTELVKTGRFNVKDPAQEPLSTGCRFDHNTMEGLMKGGSTFCQLGQGDFLTNNRADPSDNGGQWNLGVLFEYNYINSIKGRYGEQPSVKSSGHVIRYNYWRGGRGVPKLRQCHRTRVYGNFFESLEKDTVTPLSMNGSNLHVYGNIIDMTHGKADCGIRTLMGGFLRNTAYPQCRNVIIEHNTIVNPNGHFKHASVVANFSQALTRNHAGCENEIWRNNLIVADTGAYAAPVSVVVTSPVPPVSLSALNNLVCGSAAPGGLLTVYGTNTVTGDPRLDHAYRPAPGSPAIKAGASIGTEIQDYYGRPIRGRPDIGAVQTF